MGRLQGKHVVVTAAASGMGRAGCELFAREGAKVAAVDIDRERLTHTVASIENAGGEAHAVVADLAQAEAVKRAIHEAADRLGGIDLLWNHAGVPGPSEVEGLDLDAYAKSIALNLSSGLIASGEAIAYMRQRGGGSILFTSSISGIVGSNFSPIYSAQKFGVVGLAKSLAKRFACDGVRVNVVCPGATDTPMLPSFTSRAGDPEEAERNKGRVLSMVPLGRVGRSEEVAQAALWLLSDEASYVTGAVLPVDGGMTC